MVSTKLKIVTLFLFLFKSDIVEIKDCHFIFVFIQKWYCFHNGYKHCGSNNLLLNKNFKINNQGYYLLTYF